MSAGFSPFDTQFKGILDRVCKLESNVGKDVASLNSERVSMRWRGEYIGR